MRIKEKNNLIYSLASCICIMKQMEGSLTKDIMYVGRTKETL